MFSKPLGLTLAVVSALSTRAAGHWEASAASQRKALPCHQAVAPSCTVVPST
jgi:hypothetical protein